MWNFCRNILRFVLLLQWAALVQSEDDGHIRRRTTGWNEAPIDVALSLDLPGQVVDNIADLEVLVQLTQQFGLCNDDNPGFDTFEVFRDVDDLAIVARRDNNCFVVFQATVPYNPFDIFQLYDWSSRDIGTCKVRGGIYKAYHSWFYDDLVAAVGDCMINGNGELFVGGHSQGGAIAVVASMDLKRHNPIVVTFGATRSVLDSTQCSDLNPERHFRFVNTVGNCYDGWPMKFNHRGVHVGHAILLDPVASQPAAYVGLNDNTNRIPNDRAIHATSFYFPAISKLLESSAASSFAQIRISGWEDGHFCSGNDECNGSCINSHCTS